jgi:hypothetical protein
MARNGLQSTPGAKAGGNDRRPGFWKRLKTNPHTQFWTGFWTVILALAAIYGYAQITIAQKSRLVVDPTGQIKAVPEFADEWKKIADDLGKLVTVEIDEKAPAELQAQIDARIDEAYTPVYNQIPKLADFHYSLRGEYTELLAVLANKGASKLTEILFDEVNLSEKLNNSAGKIDESFRNILGQALGKIRTNLQTSANFTAGEISLLTGALKLSLADTEARFSTQLTALRAGGATIAAAMVLSKATGQKAAAVLAEKIAAKAAMKAGAKVAAPGAAGASAALLCSWGGPLTMTVCGAGAAGAAWLAADEAIIVLDEYYNREAFEADMRKLIDEQKAEVKSGFQKNYGALLAAVSNDYKTRLKNVSTPAEAARQP